MSTREPTSDEALRSRRDKALIHAAWSGSTVRVLTALLGAGTVAVAVRELGDARFGIVATLSAMVGLLGFSDLGIGQGLLTMLATARGQDDATRMRQIVSSAWVALLGVGAVVTVLGVLLALVLPWPTLLGSQGVPSGQVVAAVVVFAVAVGLAIPATIGARVLIGLQRSPVVYGWQLVAAALTLLSVVACGRLDAPLAAYVAATVGVPTLVNGVQSVWVLGRRHRELRPQLGLVRFASVREVANLSGLFLGLNLSIAVAYQTDSIVVASVLGAATAGVFAVALRMFTLVTGLFTGASQQMWPALAESMARGDVEWARSRFVRVAGGAVAASAVICAVLVVIGPWVAEIWVGESLVPPRSLFVVFAIWTVYNMGMGQASLVMNAARVVRPQLYMFLAMAVTNLPLSIYLTHRVGITGPIIGSLVSHLLFVAVPSAVYVRRVLWGSAATRPAAPVEAS